MNFSQCCVIAGATLSGKKHVWEDGWMAVVVITGTGTGTGLATAATLARNGHKVFAGMRNPDRGGELREIASKDKLPIEIVQLDVNDDASVDDAFKAALKESGHIDVLVNN